ncbi:hypothetical protein A0128_04375 [Leptospira tipperaryensis]|uniref:Uncharacterized protein n=1 Tax=Leptospira tipperaryensis TaxID=2564040 RepID=A0A1D7UUB0_9LEPT|nr:hypothetical protein A0128_04375 [Leptospira tipperaryensis]
MKLLPLICLRILFFEFEILVLCSPIFAKNIDRIFSFRLSIFLISFYLLEFFFCEKDTDSSFLSSKNISEN